MGDIVRRVSKANPKLSELIIPEGKVLFNEGDKASAMYIVQDGEIEISVDNARHVVAHLRKGRALESNLWSVRSTDLLPQEPPQSQSALKSQRAGWENKSQTPPRF